MSPGNRTLYCLKRDFFSLSNLLLVASGVLLLDAVVSTSFTAFIGFTAALLAVSYLAFQQSAIQFVRRFQRWGKVYRIAFPVLLFSLVGTAFLLDSFADPAVAQFFNKTQAWMQTAFPVAGGGQGSTNIYGLIFNVLRAIFVIYLAIALVRVIAASRNDEDWQTLARTPLIILITVTLGDILAGFITGGGAAGGA